MGSSFSL